MTLQEVIEAARYVLNEPLSANWTFPDNSTGFWQDVMLMTYHNMVQQDVMNEMLETGEEFFITQTSLNIVAGTAEYSLPTRFVKIRRVEDYRNAASPTEILPSTINERREWPAYLAPSGTYAFGHYYLRGNQIVFTDTPTFTNTSAIRLYYVRAISDVTQATVSSDLPVEFHNILVWGIVKHARMQEQSNDQMAAIEYERLMNKMKSQADQRQIQRSRRVIDTRPATGR